MEVKLTFETSEDHIGIDIETLDHVMKLIKDGYIVGELNLYDQNDEPIKGSWLIECNENK